MSNPSLKHYKYLNNIFSYLLKTKNYGLDLTLQSKSQSNIYKTINLIGISDSDQGGDLDTRKSTSGNLFILQNNLNNQQNKNIAISQISKLQKVVVISSAKTEYIALKEATKENLYLDNFLKELFSYNSIKEMLRT